MQWLAIVFLSILACITYGIIHDQVTARICIEYFTVGHPRVVPSQDPTVLGIVWGVIATWWVGVMLGVPLATVARIGSRAKRSVGSLYAPIAILFCASAVAATGAGIAGYVAASNGWVSLRGELAENVPQDKHLSFIVDLWAHNGSYFAGLVGGITLMVVVWRSRRRAGLAIDT